MSKDGIDPARLKRRLHKALRHLNAKGDERYSDEEVLTTLTALLLQLLGEVNLESLDQESRELFVMAALHAGVHDEMTQDQFDTAVVAFLSANPPNEWLLRRLKKALGDKPLSGSG